MDAFDRRDRAAWLALCDENYEVVPIGDWPEHDVIEGREAAWDFYRQVIDVFESQDFGDVELRDAGADKVLVHQQNEIRGRESGASVEMDYWVVVTFRDGKVFRDQWFADRAEALKAGGLSD